MKPKFFCVFLFSLCVVSISSAATLKFEDQTLLPNTPNQQIAFTVVPDGSGTAFTGFEIQFFIDPHYSLEDGITPLPPTGLVPVITAGLQGGTVFSGKTLTIVHSMTPVSWGGDFALLPDSAYSGYIQVSSAGQVVSGTGIAGYLTVDTTGITHGSWPVVLDAPWGSAGLVYQDGTYSGVINGMLTIPGGPSDPDGLSPDQPIMPLNATTGQPQGLYQPWNFQLHEQGSGNANDSNTINPNGVTWVDPVPADQFMFEITGGTRNFTSITLPPTAQYGADADGLYDIYVSGQGWILDQAAGATVPFAGPATKFYITDIITGVSDYDTNPSAFPVGLTFDGVGSVDFTMTPVPEPSTLALLALGLVGLAVTAIRRRG